MSWSQLLAHLQWSDPPAPPSSSASVSASPSSASRLIVLQDSLSTPSDAVFLAFVWSKLSGGGRVAVVLTQRSIPHCHAAALKAGCPLSSFESSGRLQWLDLFAPFHPSALEAEAGAHADALFGAEQHGQMSQPSSLPASPFQLPHLFHRLQQLRAEHGPLHIAIDDVIPLASHTAQASALPRIHSFLCRLQSLTVGDGPAATAGALLVRLPGDVECVRPLLSLLSSSASLHVRLEPLTTGASRDVQGALTSVRRDVHSGCVISHSTLHYQHTATAISLFERGRHSRE